MAEKALIQNIDHYSVLKLPELDCPILYESDLQFIVPKALLDVEQIGLMQNLILTY
jgi:hypothetical protein